MATTRRLKVLKRVGMAGAGKSVMKKEYGIHLLAGQNGSGKTIEIIKAVKKYIAQQKKRKEDWKVWVFTSTPDEFKGFNPTKRKSAVLKIKSQVFVSDDIAIFNKRVFRDGLIIMDNEFASRLKFNDIRKIIFSSSRQLDVILSYNSVLAIQNEIFINSDYLKVFKNIPITQGQRDTMVKSGINLPLIDIADCVTDSIKTDYYSQNFGSFKGKKIYDRYTLVDLQNNKIICDPILFFFACKSIAQMDNEYNISGLIQMSDKLAKYATYFKQK